LDKDKEVSEVIEEARKKIMIARLLQDEVSDKVEVSNAEIEAYYDENKERFVRPETLRARHILVKTEEEANKIKSELARGKDFAELAKLYSDGPNASAGGELGFIGKGTLSELIFEEEAFFTTYAFPENKAKQFYLLFCSGNVRLLWADYKDVEKVLSAEPGNCSAANVMDFHIF